MSAFTMYMFWNKEQSLTSPNRWFYSAETTRRKELKKPKKQASFYSRVSSAIQLAQTPRGTVFMKVKKYISKALGQHFTIQIPLDFEPLGNAFDILIPNDEYRQLKIDVIKV